MQKKSYEGFKYTKYSQYNVINVWDKDGSREAVVKRKLLTDPNFKLTSLQVNPLYKPIFDKLDAQAAKQLAELDKSVLWSRKYQKQDFKWRFLYPGIMWIGALIYILHYGVKYRIFQQYIKHGRKSDLAEYFDIDLEDVESYPPAVFDEFLEKKRLDALLKKKEENIKKVEDRFHEYSRGRLRNLAERRKKRGLQIEGGHSDSIVVKKK